MFVFLILIISLTQQPAVGIRNKFLMGINSTFFPPISLKSRRIENNTLVEKKSTEKGKRGVLSGCFGDR